MSTLMLSPVLVSPKDDAISLYRAFKGLGCDTGTIVNILAHRNIAQRFSIQKEYRDMYCEDLTKRLSSELSGHLKRAILLWMPDPPGRDAITVRESLTLKESLYLDIHRLKVATELICCRTPAQIEAFKQRYSIMYGVPLAQDIESHASGDLKRLLIAYVTKRRYDEVQVNEKMAEKDAKALYKAGENKLGTDENIFIEIFSERSRAHLAAVSSAYQTMYGNPLKKAIQSETSGNFGLGLLTILRCALKLNHAKYNAKVLYKSMEGLGTDNATLTRVVVTRTEIDMQKIKDEYLKMYKKPLSDDIHGETSGHFRTFLIALLGPNH